MGITDTCTIMVHDTAGGIRLKEQAEQAEHVDPAGPADMAFASGSLKLPATPPEAVMTETGSGLAGTILSALSLVIVILIFKKTVNIIPAVTGCLLRWKENTNLEASVKMSRDRSITAAAMFIPFCLVVENFGLYAPDYMQGLCEDLRIAATACTFAAYFSLKTIAAAVCRPGGSKADTYTAGYKSAWSSFVILTLMLLSVAGIAGFAGIDHSAARITMLWLSAVIYSILLLREFQIFASSCSYITAFLYLCALEIVPSGLLVGSVYVF